MSASIKASRTRSKQPNGITHQTTEHGKSPQRLWAPFPYTYLNIIASDATAKRSTITSPGSAKATFVASISRSTHAGAELDRVEPRFQTLQQMPSQSVIPNQDTPAFVHDDDQNIEDNRSSSLSDIGDTGDDNEPYARSRNSNGLSDGIDSEAETERLEQSPQKIRKNMSVLFTQEEAKIEEESTDLNTEIVTGATEEGMKVGVVSPPVLEKESPNLNTVTGAKFPTILTTTLLGGMSGDTAGIFSPPEIAGTKRKRTPSRSRSPDGNLESEAYARKRTGSIKSKSRPEGNGVISDHTGAQTREPSAQDITNVSPAPQPGAEVEEAATQDVEDLTSEVVVPEDESNRTKRPVKGKKGRRKGKKQRNGEPGDLESVDPIEDETARIEPNPVISVAENGETGEGLGEMEGEEEGAEATLRSEEELVKKNLALDSLSAIEKHFATFKDKLYDERLAQLDNELELLSQPNPTHSEYLAMMRCIDARLHEKISHEQILLSYKIRALEVKSVAERSQLHSQYFQDVRDIREKKLEEVGEQWYQIQRDRRGWDGSVPDLMYKFPTRRSQQITQQTAYNMEVSILSGVAKYVGFPAAPSIDGARTAEIEEDLKSIGIKPSVRTALHSHQPPLSTAISRVSFPNTRPAAEEQFLEQTPWANPQHPAHHHLQQVQRQMPRQSHMDSPFSTSAGQRRVIDPNARGEGSAATSAPSTTVPVSSDVQTLVHPYQAQPRNSTEADPVGVSSRATIGVSNLEVKGPSPTIQQALLFSPPVTYAGAQMHLKAPTRQSTGSQGTPHQRAAISPTLSSLTRKATASNSHGLTPRTGTLGNSSALDSATPEATGRLEEEGGEGGRVSSVLGQLQHVPNNVIPI